MILIFSEIMYIFTIYFYWEKKTNSNISPRNIKKRKLFSFCNDITLLAFNFLSAALFLHFIFHSIFLTYHISQPDILSLIQFLSLFKKITIQSSSIYTNKEIILISTILIQIFEVLIYSDKWIYQIYFLDYVQ